MFFPFTGAVVNFVPDDLEEVTKKFMTSGHFEYCKNIGMILR